MKARRIVWCAVALLIQGSYRTARVPAQDTPADQASFQEGAAAEVEAAPVPQSAETTSGTAEAGTKVTAEFTANPPQLTLEQAQALAEGWAKANRTGPMQPTTPAPLTKPGPEMPPPSPTAAAPSGFTVYRDNVIPASAIDGGYSFSSYTMEPSTGVNGKNIFQTGNWYASRSLNGGATWSYLNPFSIFGGNFCCDQVTLYDAEWDRQFWLLQYNGTLKLANSTGNSLFSSWCYYNIDATWFGDAASTEIDYNDMAVSKNYIYIASNLFPSGGSGYAGILRLPISPLTQCAGFGYSRYRDTSRFTFKPVQGAVDTMYWGSNWGGANGSSFRLYSWAESGAFNVFDIGIDAFNFMYRNNGQFCGSADKVVTNWCAFNDSRVKGGYVAKGVIGFSFDVTQGSGYPFPYVRRVYFRESDKAYLGASALWASWGAIQYGTMSPNANGNIGMAWAWGGGTGTTHYYPGTGYTIDDDFAPSQPWSYIFQIWGQGNTCTYGGIPRWGDYNTTRPDYPAGYAWIGGGWAIKGGNCGAAGAFSEPHNVVFGRNRESAAVARWQAK
jgi:hypothetical protein